LSNNLRSFQSSSYICGYGLGTLHASMYCTCGNASLLSYCLCTSPAIQTARMVRLLSGARRPFTPTHWQATLRSGYEGPSRRVRGVYSKAVINRYRRGVFVWGSEGSYRYSVCSFVLTANVISFLHSDIGRIVVFLL